MNHVVIFAGGTGSRMNSRNIPKQFLKIYGKPVIIHTIEVFDKSASIDNIVVVIIKGWEELLNSLLEQYRIKKVSVVITGGETGQQSIYNGLKELDDGIVLIHDGVRPFISNSLIEENIEIAKNKKIAITCVKAKETLVSVSKNKIDNVLNRDVSFMARAPQTFDVSLLKAAHHKAMADNDYSFVDSCAIVSKYFPELDLNVVECGSENIKITTQEDFYLAKAMFSLEEDEQLYGFKRGDEK